MSNETARRLSAAKAFCASGGEVALGYFNALDSLEVEQKGPQDLVSQADREVEDHIRQGLLQLFPDDGIVGEEHPPVRGRSGYTWVIDPIDGTANFVAGIPAWCVVIACVKGHAPDGQTVLGATFDVVHGQMFWAVRGGGAFCNGAPIHVVSSCRLDDGTVGVGFSNRTPPGVIAALVGEIVARGGLFYRNASGALSLAYVASGRLTGYAEDHMNAWDCLAGQLLVAEAGGCVEGQDAGRMIAAGGRVIVAAPGVFPDLLAIATDAFSQ